MKVSIITPYTVDRLSYIDRLASCINAQTYKDIEWLGDEGPGSIGHKRNRLCLKATGDLIVHFDSDDWYAPDYIARTVEHLISTGADVTGVNTLWFHDERCAKSWLYEYNGRQPYVVGSGMVYYRGIAIKNPFQDISIGEDMHFLKKAGSIQAMPYHNKMFARIHGSNTASQQILPCLQERSEHEFREVFRGKAF